MFTNLTLTMVETCIETGEKNHTYLKIKFIN
jgi:hypothetical protein